MIGTKGMKRWLRGSFAACAMALSSVSAVAAQGWIEPGVDRGGFTVDRVRSEVRVHVEGRVASIEVSEWFTNRGARLAEGEYLYPLPGEAVFQGFSLYQGETELRGEIMDADAARSIYEEIVRRRADPALIELAGEGLIRARVFPIQPGETRQVKLRYTQVLERAGDALQLSYAGGVRGAQSLANGTPQVAQDDVETRFEIVVDDCDGFLDPFSPTHALDVRRMGERMVVSVDGEVVGRMAVFLPLVTEGVSMSVATHRPFGDDGYFMLTLSPGQVRGEVQPRDVTVVMDVSGSMSGEKIEQARAALHQLLGSLSGEDRFRLLSFSSRVRAEDDSWAHARGRRLSDARDWVDRLEADGGTNIEAALQEAFRLESPRGRLPVVLFLTDGLPSVGLESPQELAEIAETRADRARVFAFGVGHDVNTQLLDRLGEAGRGDTDYVQPGENVERALSLLAAKIQHPVLTDLHLEGGPVDLDEVYPVRIPDVFAGEELVLFGRYTGDGQSQMTVRGERAGRPLDFSTELRFPEASDANEYIPRLWASRKLGHLERQVWTEGLTEELAAEIREVALRYGLPSRYTSYLVQEPELVAMPVDNAVGPVRRLGNTITTLGQSIVGGGSGAARQDAAAPTTGATAVEAAEAARARRATASVAALEKADEEAAADLMENLGNGVARMTVGGRVFEERDGVWVDGAHLEDAPTLRIARFSRAWFDVVGALPEVERLLREYESVVVAGEGISLQIGAEGVDAFTSTELAELVASFRSGER